METQIKRHEPLYLKYRPQALSQLVGQVSVTRTLINAITYDRLSHAYLFTGPRGTGKTSTARILAKSLNCKAFEKATIDPCQKCASCLEVRTGTSPAVFEIDAASNNSVDDARVLIERAPLVAAGGRYKVYIIDECHMLTKEAFNALLKTIEDPPPNVMFVLATTEEHKVLPTIVSRCQRLIFRLVVQDDLITHLKTVAEREQIHITDRALEFIARRSGGGLRDALGLLDQSSLLAAPGQPVDVADLLSLLGALQEDLLLAMSEHILHRRGHELLSVSGQLMHEGREPALIVQELARHFLNLAKCSYLSDEPDKASQLVSGAPDYIAKLCTQSPHFERSELSQLVEALDKLEQACRRSTQPAMHLEVGLLGLCHRHDMLLVRELSQRVANLEKALGTTGSTPELTPHPVPHKPPHESAGKTAAAVKPQTEQASAPSLSVTTLPERGQAVLQSARQAPAIIEAKETAAEESLPSQALVSDRRLDSAYTEQATTNVTQLTAATAQTPEVSAEAEPTSASPDEIDRVWSQTLDELQRRHIPTYSLASVHAVPLSLTDNELVLGTKEILIKSLEPKLDHIKAACATVVGRAVQIRIKQITVDVPRPKTTAAKPRERSAATAPTRQQTPPETDEDYEPGPTESDQPKVQESAAPTEATESERQPASLQPSEDAGDRNMPASMSTRNRAHLDEPVRADTTVIKEAYKLFEGPGSRQIGQKPKQK